MTAGLLALGALALGPAPADADTVPVGTVPATVSSDPLPTWQISGVVWSQVVVGTTVYATGNFTRARPPGVPAGGSGEIAVGHLIAYDIRTGARVTSFNHVLNAPGQAITASPDGSRVYVGGDFTTVDNQARSHLAAFDTATGALTGFAPAVDNQVKTLTASSTTVYAGGSFTAVTQAGAIVPRRFLASFVATSGLVTSWAPTGAEGIPWALTMTPDRTRVIAGGQFQTLNGSVVNGMAALDATTAAVRPWAANQVIKDYNKAAIDTLTTDGTYIYGGGWAFGTGNFEGTFALRPSDGSIVWMNDCQGDTYGVAPVGGVLYSVGHTHNCTMVGGFVDTNPRTRWQGATAFTTAPSGANNSGPDIYGWNYSARPRGTLLHWYPKLALGTASGQSQAAWNVVSGSGYVALGGEFPKANDVLQQGLVRYALSSVAPNKAGPKYDDTAPVRTTTPATTATQTDATTIRVTFGAAWDTDNQRLTYRLYRDRGTAAEKLVTTRTVDSSFWVLPQQVVTDSAVPTGTHSYQVVVTDPFGNQLLSPTSNQVTIGGNIAPTAAFTATVDRLTGTFSGAASTDPDGSVVGYAWDFGDGTRASGVSTTHTYAAAGTYTVTLTVTDDKGATGRASKTVSAGTATAPRVQDTFTRTVSPGWGSAETGGTWTLVGSSSLFAVSGGQGRIQLNAGSGPSARLAATGTDTDLSLTWGFDKPSTGSGGLFTRSVVRGDTSNGYLTKIFVSPSSQTMTLALVRAVGGTETELGRTTLPGTFVPGTRYRLRVQAVGSGTTTLRARSWVDQATEPTTWAVSATDTTASLQAAGGVAVHGYASGSVTNAPITLLVDDVLVRPTTG